MKIVRVKIKGVRECIAGGVELEGNRVGCEMALNNRVMERWRRVVRELGLVKAAFG